MQSLQSFGVSIFSFKQVIKKERAREKTRTASRKGDRKGDRKGETRMGRATAKAQGVYTHT